MADQTRHTQLPCGQMTATGKTCTRTAIIFGKFAGGLCLTHAVDLAINHNLGQFRAEHRGVVGRALKARES